LLRSPRLLRCGRASIASYRTAHGGRTTSVADVDSRGDGARRWYVERADPVFERPPESSRDDFAISGGEPAVSGPGSKLKM